MPQVLPRLHHAIRGLSLRQRILLLFLGLAGGSLLALFVALYLAYVKHPSPWSLDALITAGVLSGCATVLLILGLWRLFDENVAKPLERMAGELRARVHSHIAGDLEDLQARHLGDLAPAATALMRHLNQARNELAETVARETTREVLEKEKCLALLAGLPIAVVACTPDHKLALYNERARAMLAASFRKDTDGQHVTVSPSTVCLGRALGDYLDIAPLLAVYEKLCENGRPSTIRNLTSTKLACGLDCEVHMRLLDEPVAPYGLQGPAYLLTLNARGMPEPLAPPAAAGQAAKHELIYDFDLLGHPLHRGVSDLPLNARTYVVLDTETTGLLPERGDEIVQLAAVRIVNGKIIPGEVLNTLVNPGRPIPPLSTQIHGITDSMVAQAPPIEQVARQLHDFAQGAVLVAHNADFDMAFLRRVESRAGLRFEQPVLDTAVLSALVFGVADNHSLDALAARLGVKLSAQARHTALGDATATAEILLKLLPALQARNLPKP